jgi:hypothetical protein
LGWVYGWWMTPPTALPAMEIPIRTVTCSKRPVQIEISKGRTYLKFEYEFLFVTHKTMRSNGLAIVYCL